MAKYSLYSYQYSAKQFRVHVNLSCTLLNLSYALTKPLFNKHKVFLREKTLYFLLRLQLFVSFIIAPLIRCRRLLQLLISWFNLLSLLDLLVESLQVGDYFFRFF
jgi:hypothetical protein